MHDLCMQVVKETTNVSSKTQPLLIEELQNHGINIADIIKLKSAGICTLQRIAMSTKKSLCKIKGLSELKVDKIKDILREKLKICTFCSASDYAVKRETVNRISTGSEEFDALLGGGIQTMSITEVFGEFRTGKTQLATTLSVTSQITNNELNDCKTIYIDTEGTFRPERVREICGRFDIDYSSVLDNILVARPYNTEQLDDLIDKLQMLLAEQINRFKLLVIDSIINLFRSDFVGRGELGERQQKLNQILSKLIKLAEEHNIAVFITNQMMSDPGSTMSFVSDPKKPIGGHILAHASTTRIYLRKGKENVALLRYTIVQIYLNPKQCFL